MCPRAQAEDRAGLVVLRAPESATQGAHRPRLDPPQKRDDAAASSFLPASETAASVADSTGIVEVQQILGRWRQDLRDLQTRLAAAQLALELPMRLCARLRRCEALEDCAAVRPVAGPADGPAPLPAQLAAGPVRVSAPAIQKSHDTWRRANSPRNRATPRLPGSRSGRTALCAPSWVIPATSAIARFPQLTEPRCGYCNMEHRERAPHGGYPCR